MTSPLVYGGGNVGLMGTIADSIIAHGGKSIGIIPRFLKDKEVAHHGLSELIITEDMASRKLKMISLADAFYYSSWWYWYLRRAFRGHVTGTIASARQANWCS